MAIETDDSTLRPFEALDPLRVLLPAGTQVVTRAPAQNGSHALPQGSVARVLRYEGEAVVVSVTGADEFTFRRSDLRPRKTGQLRFAKQRAATWDTFSRCIVLEAQVGSRAWGLAQAHSDDDRRGVFAHPLSFHFGLSTAAADLVSECGSATYWSTEKAVQQALRADPNTLEVLFAEQVVAHDELGQWLLDAREAFVSQEIYGSFGRYAVAQLRRLEQAQRLAEHRAVLLEWLQREPSLTLDDVAQRLAMLTADGKTVDTLRTKEYIKQLYRSMFDQGLLSANNFEALQEFAATHAHRFELPRELRPKNAYNLLRLLWTAEHWLRDGTPCFKATGSFRERLLAIKLGQVPLKEVLNEADLRVQELEDALRQSPLPKKPDITRADDVLKQVGLELARRWVLQVPGPFGRDAPHPPLEVL